MTDQQKLDEIIALMTFLQQHIQNCVVHSFTNLTFNLETVIKDYLNVFESDSEQYININYLQHNYPAVDLVNNAKSKAIQVTTNADLRKVRKTVETYQRHSISYSELIVIGFVKATNSTLPNVTVYNIDFLIELAKYGTSPQKDKIYEILKRQIPWNCLSPLDDKLCFDIIFDVINRSAIRDYTLCEGNYDRMLDGMFEVKEIITTGKITEKNIRAKSSVEFNSDVREKLQEIEFFVSQIIQICNTNKNKRHSDYLDFSKEGTREIDDLKSKIIQKTNDLAASLNISKELLEVKEIKKLRLTHALRFAEGKRI